MSVAIDVDSLSKKYRIGEYHAAYGTLRESLVHAAKRLTGREHDRPATEIWALQDVSFQVPEGQVLGVIGRNGAGKSTLLKILTRIVTPTSGRAEIRGRVGSLLEVGTGFNQELTGRENVYLNGAILGMKRAEIERRFDEIVDFSGVEQFIDTPVKRYSSGMYIRLAFAVSAHFEPEIMLVDEVLSVGDAEFQRRCLGRMEELGNAGRTVVFVSHALGSIAQLCDRAIWIDGGRVVGDGKPAEVIANYLHQTHSAGTERSWSEESAPGNDLARILSIRARPHEGMPPGVVDVRRPIGIEIGFKVLRAGKPLFPKIKVLDEEGAVAFNAMDTDERWLEPTPPGEYVSTAWIPGNLLNEGSAVIEAAICSLDFPKLEHHAAVYEAISVEVLDPGEGDSARGRFSGQWRGVVRPLLDWTVERV
jgi:lipopolysaccharide transport system ATP-binding protein